MGMSMYKDSWTLLTGGTRGIGLAMARLIAARGGKLLLVARDAQQLAQTAQALTNEFGSAGCEIKTHAADLTRRDQIDGLVDALRAQGVVVKHLINNAGIGSYGPFLERDLQRETDQVMLNIVAPLELTRRLAPAMVGVDGAGILNIASSAGFQPTPYMATYGATKAFVISFSEALWAEYRGQGLRVTCACPGATDTGFFDSGHTAGMRKAVSTTGFADSSAVARDILAAYERGTLTPVLGVINKALVQSVRITPRTLMAVIAERLLRPRR